MSVRLMAKYIQGQKIENLVNFPRAEPKPVEIEIHLLNRKILIRPLEKKRKKSHGDNYVKSESFRVFPKIRWAKESEITYTQ